ncbi:MAG: tetratricopeptide repeat protein [Anaerolineales bacterium]|nr:tetratricopeptide repeat protein [Anaerolineales bacterium]
MTSAPPISDPLELDVMRRALQRAHGFALYFARANTPVLQKQLHSWLSDNLTRPLLLVHLQPGEPIVEQLQAAEQGLAENAILSVMGMDQMPKTDDDDWLPRQLNWRREAFHRLFHPVLIWLPEYLLLNLMSTAPDFFDWHSGFFEFEMSEEARREVHTQQMTAWDRPMLARNEGERRERIAVLRGLLEDYEHANVDTFIIAQTQRTLGALYWEASEYYKAIDYYKQALEIDRKIKNRRGEGADLGNLGVVYSFLGKSREAAIYHARALEINQEINDSRGEGAELTSLGLVHVELGETVKAIEYYERALTIAIQIGDRRNESQILGNLGLAYAVLGKLSNAIEYYKQAQTIAVEIGDRRGQCNQLINLGVAYKNQGEEFKAIQYYEKAYKIALEIGDIRMQGLCLGNLGLAFIKLGEVSKAIEHYENALAIAVKIGDLRGESIRLNNLGEAYLKLGEIDRAKAYTQQALTLFEQIESPLAEQARRKLAEWEKDDK